MFSIESADIMTIQKFFRGNDKLMPSEIFFVHEIAHDKTHRSKIIDNLQREANEAIGLSPPSGLGIRETKTT